MSWHRTAERNGTKRFARPSQLRTCSARLYATARMLMQTKKPSAGICGFCVALTGYAKSGGDSGAASTATIDSQISDLMTSEESSLSVHSETATLTESGGETTNSSGSSNSTVGGSDSVITTDDQTASEASSNTDESGELSTMTMSTTLHTSESDEATTSEIESSTTEVQCFIDVDKMAKR